MRLFAELTIVLCRVWTSTYTCGMPAAARAARRAEIESDLWECEAEEKSAATLATTVLLRLVRGMPHDLLWRIEVIGRRPLARRSVVAAVGALAVLLLAVFWVGSLLKQELPEPAPMMRFISAPRPPPPPPPPPPDDFLRQQARVDHRQRDGIDR